MGISHPASVKTNRRATARPASIVAFAFAFCVYVALVSLLAYGDQLRRAEITAGVAAIAAVVIASVAASIRGQADDGLWGGLALAAVIRAAAAFSLATGLYLKSVDSDFRSFSFGCCLGSAVVFSLFLAVLIRREYGKRDLIILGFDMALFTAIAALAIALPIQLVGRSPYTSELQVEVAIAAVGADGLALGLLLATVWPRLRTNPPARWLLGGWVFLLLADWETGFSLVARGVDRSQINLVISSATFALGLAAIFRLSSSLPAFVGHGIGEMPQPLRSHHLASQAIVGSLGVGFAAVIAIETTRHGEYRYLLTLILASVGLALAVCRLMISASMQHSAIATLNARQSELERLALSDSITELPNHRALIARLTEEVERARRFKQPLSVCFVDVDAFKQINDTHGHQVGDDVLREIGAMLRANARQIDIVGRYGGEEFVLLLPGTWTDDAQAFAERLRESVAITTFSPQADVEVRLSVSVGVAGLPEHASDRDALLKRADDAVYVAKRSGRNQVSLFNPDFTTTTGRLLSANDAERLVQVVERRERTSVGHGERVGRLSAALAQRLGLEESEVDRIHLAGRLHDLGKIAVPDSILVEAETLSSRDYEIIRSHPLVGARLLEGNPSLVLLASALRHHHERWDGSGYSYRLAGENIPLAARIIAIAEAYDAMTNESPWRAQMSHAQAIAELSACAGKQFDPKLVVLFFRIVESSRL
ncbi:MAG: diguanylate cyclase [Thermomicrobiales bacterium]